jgi:hypothetical protein
MATERDPDAPEPEEEYHLHTELGHELERLGTHPVQEIRRLSEEAKEGEVETTPAIVIAGVAIWVWLVVAVILGASIVAVYLATG